MQYITHQRFRKKCLCGSVNIPALTLCETSENIIVYNGNPLCFTTSEDAYQYFARNDDGQGLRRGKLTHAIQKKLENRSDPLYQTRWDAIWNDLICQKYKRTDHSDHWLWNHEFFNASIEDLQYIARLIGVKEESKCN